MNAKWIQSNGKRITALSKLYWKFFEKIEKASPYKFKICNFQLEGNLVTKIAFLFLKRPREIIRSLKQKQNILRISSIYSVPHLPIKALIPNWNKIVLNCQGTKA